MPPISVLIKPASSKCNLKCQYCFYHDVANNRAVADFGLMSLETAEIIIKKALQFASGQATFSFQGGEPTLCGIDFYKAIVKMQNRLNINNVAVNNCLQTNGILLNQEWAEFLRDYKFLVGLSLDGPADLHDAYRTDAKGNGTYRRVIEAAARLNQYKVDYNILFTVTNASAGSPDKLYKFFKKYSFNFLQFMPCIEPLEQEHGTHSYSLDPKHYAIFLKSFFDQWFTDFMGGREINVRYFDNLVRILMGMPPEMCSLFGACQCQFVFEADGSVYPCDFYVTDEWKLGNIRDNELLEIYESNNCSRFKGSSLSIATACRKCQWQNLCRGGCRRDKENPHTKELALNYYCQAYRDFFDYTYPRLVKAAQYVKTIQSRPRTARVNPITRKG